MDAATFYLLIVCTGTNVLCERPFGWAPSFDREECLQQMWAIRVSDPDKRVVCLKSGIMSGSPPEEIIDSAKSNRDGWSE
jgi:hypothetical protein